MSVSNYLCTLHNNPERRRSLSRVFGNSCDENERQTFSRHAINLYLTKLIKSILNVSIHSCFVIDHNKTNTVRNKIQNIIEQYTNLFLHVPANPGHPKRSNMHIMEGREAFKLLAIVMLFRNYTLTGINK
jgi:hypothetical protein